MPIDAEVYDPNGSTFQTTIEHRLNPPTGIETRMIGGAFDDGRFGLSDARAGSSGHRFFIAASAQPPRSACAGSARTARREGNRHASVAVVTITAATAKYVAASVAVT